MDVRDGRSHGSWRPRHRGGPDAGEGVLVGRSHELAQLMNAMRESEDATCRFVAVTGEPGIGKTALLAEFAHAAVRTGRTVLWGHGAESDTETPFGVVVTALDDLVAEADPSALEALDPDVLAPLRTILPALQSNGTPHGSCGIAHGSGGTPGVPVELAPAQRRQLHRSVRTLLERLSPADGLVLVFDDMHWADPESIELCNYLVRRSPRALLVVAVGYRSRQAPAALNRGVARGVMAGQHSLLELAPLSFEEARTLMDPDQHQATHQRLYELSGGNPFYLHALTWRAHGRSHGHPTGYDDTVQLDAVLEPIHAALAAELSGLTPDQLLVAHAAAVASDPFEPEVVAEIAGLDSTLVLAAFDHLARRYVIRPTRAGGRFEFYRPLLRTVVYLSAGAGWKLGAHARAARALHDRGAPAAARAYHLERSAGVGETEAVHVLVEAATAELQTAPATAAHRLAVALRLRPTRDDGVPSRVELLTLLARAQGLSGQLRESRSTMHEVLRLLPQDGSVHRAQAVVFCALLDRLLGRRMEGQAMLIAELTKVDDENGPATVLLKLELATAGLMVDSAVSKTRWAHDALEAARRGDDTGRLAAALAVRAATDVRAGTVSAQTAEWTDEAAAFVDAMADGDLARHLETTVWLGGTEIYLKNLNEALRHLQRGLRLSRQTGQLHLVTILLVAVGTVYGLMGNLDLAIKYLDEGLESANVLRSNELRLMALGQHAWVAGFYDLDAAERYGEEALSLSGPSRSLYTLHTKVMNARTAIHRGDHRRGAEALVRAAGGPELPAADPLTKPMLYQLLTYAETEQGNTEAAHGWAKRAAAGCHDLPLLRGYAFLAEGQARLREDPAGAADAAHAAAGAFTLAGSHIGIGRAQLLSANACALLGHYDDAAEEYSLARETLESCGAELWVRRVARARRRLDAMRRRVPDSESNAAVGNESLAQLTRREQEIARLLAQNLTNRDIASRLYVSIRTVEVHVARVLLKLDVPVRSAVAAKLAAIDNA